MNPTDREFWWSWRGALALLLWLMFLLAPPVVESPGILLGEALSALSVPVVVWVIRTIAGKLSPTQEAV